MPTRREVLVLGGALALPRALLAQAQKTLKVAWFSEGTLERHKAYLVGTWRMVQTVTNAAGTMRVESVITFARDGSHAGTETRLFSGMISTVPRTGNWDVTPQSETSFALAMTEEGGSAHAVLRIIDRDTMFNEAARVNVSRVR